MSAARTFADTTAPICTTCKPRRPVACARCSAWRPPAVRWPEGPLCDSCLEQIAPLIAQAATAPTVGDDLLRVAVAAYRRPRRGTEGGWADAEPSRQGADERAAAFLRYGLEVAKRGFDGLEGAAVVEKLGMAFVDEPERGDLGLARRVT
jgi:hypothetical protein